MNFKVRENSCNGLIETIKTKKLYRNMSGNEKDLLEAGTAKFESNQQIDGSNVKLRVDGDKLRGKMRLMVMPGRFSSEDCEEPLYPNVILSFTCTKK